MPEEIKTVDGIKKVIDTLADFRDVMTTIINKTIDEIAPLEMRAYALDVDVPPGVFTTSFGVVNTVPGSEIVGLPETAQTIFGVEREFTLDHIDIDDEDAPHFTVRHVFSESGKGARWRPDVEVSAAKFAASLLSPVIIGGTVKKWQPVTITIVNQTNVLRRFRAKIVGRERAF